MSSGKFVNMESQDKETVVKLHETTAVKKEACNHQQLRKRPEMLIYIKEAETELHHIVELAGFLLV